MLKKGAAKGIVWGILFLGFTGGVLPACILDRWSEGNIEAVIFLTVVETLVVMTAVAAAFMVTRDD